MTALRATQKVLRQLPTMASETPSPDRSALGDWYVTRTTVARRPLLVLISARGYLPIVVPARDVRRLPSRLPQLVVDRMARVGIPAAQRAAEADAMDPITVAPTASRSVTGILVDFVRCLPSYLPEAGWGETDLRYAEDRLAEMPCHAGGPDAGVVFPLRDVARLLTARWGAG
jgi:hypothetical protein